MRRMWMVLVISALIAVHCSGPNFSVPAPRTNSSRESLTASSATALFDQYGGSTLLPCTATGWFHPQKINKRWWFCDPDGNVFWAVAVGAVGGSQPQTDDVGTSYDAVILKKYGDSNVTWGPQQNRRLESWGFNTIGEDSVGWVYPFSTCNSCAGWPGGEQPVKMPILGEVLASRYAASNMNHYGSGYMKDLMYGLNANYTAWRASLGDFYDPAFGQWIAGGLQHDNDVLYYLQSPWTLGMFVDDSDYLWGFGGGPDFHTYPQGHTSADIAYMVLITSPVQTFDPSPESVAPVVYTDTKVHSKTAAASPPAVCSILTPCTLRDNLFKKYNGSIGALNAAWGSNYTTFDSAGTQVSNEQIGVGDGTTTVFTHSLARPPVSPESVMIQQEPLGRTRKRPIAGDCPWWIASCNISAPNMGSLRGRAGALPQQLSFINYSTGHVQITFATPPAAGTSITANYVADGWMYGSGLMDEDGRHTQWLGTNPYCLQAATACDGKDEPLANANANVATDLDGWISQFSAEYFFTIHAAMKKYAPNIPYLGLDTLGGGAAPARKEVLEGAAPYVDAVFTTWYPFVPESQQELDYMEQYLGDKPLLNFLTLAANPDSGLWRYPNPAGQFADQATRGQAYASIMSGMLTSMDVSSDGTYPWIGSVWWGLVDFWNEKTNWGLVSLEDNPYDGVCDQTTTTKDQWGYPCGGEEKNYGDVITPVEQANKTWKLLLTPP